MFTGLIEEIGTIQSIEQGEKSIRITIAAKKILDHIKPGDSISTNGVCLTVTSFDSYSFVADVMAETMRRSNLVAQKEGDRVNLERALQLGDRLGGHMVSGHIDGTGEIIDLEHEDNAIWVTISVPKHILKYIIEKGSVAVDGISLTVASVDESSFKVSIIPLTQVETTLTLKRVGEKVNIEPDLTAKYIEKFLLYGKKQEPEEQDSNITMEFLRENGFI